MNSIDFIALVVLIAMGIYGYNRGLLKTLFGVASFIVVIVVGVFVAPMAANYMAENGTLVSGISEHLEESLGLEERMTELVQQEKDNPGSTAGITQKTLITDCGIPSNWVDNLLEEAGVQDTIKNYTEEMIKTVNQSICDTLAKTIVKIIVFLVIVLVLMLVLRILAQLLGFFANLPVLSGLNRVAGCLLGIIEGVVLLWLLSLLAVAVCQSGSGTWALESIQQSALSKYILYNSELSKLFF